MFIERDQKAMLMYRIMKNALAIFFVFSDILYTVFIYLPYFAHANSIIMHNHYNIPFKMRKWARLQNPLRQKYK